MFACILDLDYSFNCGTTKGVDYYYCAIYYCLKRSGTLLKSMFEELVVAAVEPPEVGRMICLKEDDDATTRFGLFSRVASSMTVAGCFITFFNVLRLLL